MTRAVSPNKMVNNQLKSMQATVSLQTSTVIKDDEVYMALMRYEAAESLLNDIKKEQDKDKEVLVNFFQQSGKDTITIMGIKGMRTLKMQGGGILHKVDWVELKNILGEEKYNSMVKTTDKSKSFTVK